MGEGDERQLERNESVCINALIVNIKNQNAIFIHCKIRDIVIAIINMKKIEVVAAIIIKDNRILCTQRSKHKYSYISEKFEFPGGKIELGETETQALAREIKEELTIEIDIKSKFLTIEHEYPDFSIKMHSFICGCNSEKIKFIEHINHYWLTKEELMNLDWAAADMPIVKKLVNYL